MKMFHQKLQKEIIEKEAETHCQQVPEKLNPAPQRRGSKYNKPHQKKSGGETHQKCHEKSSNVRADHNEGKIQVLLIQNKIITDEKQENIKYRIYSSTGCITVCCAVENPSEKRIKKIKDMFNVWFQKKS